MLMNERRFNGLPDDLKAIIERNSGPALNERFATAWDAFLDKAREATPAAQMVAINAAAYGAMRQAAAPVADAWAADLGDKGLDGQALLQGARNLAAQDR
ncbi:hypothetical protein D9M70_511380 [compost metagenome]